VVMASLYSGTGGDMIQSCAFILTSMVMLLLFPVFCSFIDEYVEKDIMTF
jgi:hypothetical protein